MSSHEAPSKGSASQSSCDTFSPAPGRAGITGEEHRLVYRVEGDDIVILQARDHYG